MTERINRPKITTNWHSGGIVGVDASWAQRIEIYSLLSNKFRSCKPVYDLSISAQWETMFNYVSGGGVFKMLAFAFKNNTASAQTVQIRATIDGKAYGIERSVTMPAGASGREAALVFGGNITAHSWITNAVDVSGLALGWIPWEQSFLIEAWTDDHINCPACLVYNYHFT